MIRLRRILFVTKGVAPLRGWVDAARQEAPVEGAPVGCRDCPLRPGGEWESGLVAAVREGPSPQEVRELERWGCHEEDRPCAGMRRILRGGREQGAMGGHREVDDG